MTKIHVKSYTRKDGSRVKSHTRNVKKKKDVPSRDTISKKPVFSVIDSNYFPEVIHRNGKVWFRSSWETDSKKTITGLVKNASKSDTKHEYLILERTTVPIGKYRQQGKYRLYKRFVPSANPNETVITERAWRNLQNAYKHTRGHKKYIVLMTPSGTSLIPVKMKY